MPLTAIAVLLLLARPEWSPRRWRHTRGRPDDQQLAAAIHAELAAGSSLRNAVAAAAGHRPDLASVRRLALAGAPIESVAAVLGPSERLAAAVVVAARSGGRAATVFSRLADRAAADAELARQKRVLTTQARMSAVVVGVMPLLWMLFGGVARLEMLVASGAGAVALVGVVMEGLGIGLIWRLAVT